MSRQRGGKSRAREGAALPLLSDAVERMRRSGIREIMDLAAAGPDVLHLEIGEPDFPTPAHVVGAAGEKMRDGQVKYTLSRGLPSLREALAEKLRARNGIGSSLEDVVVTAGGTTAIFEALLVLVRPGDGVLLPDPGWPAFEMIVTLLRGEPLRYRLLRETGYEPDLDEVGALANRARILIVNTPSNPTGAVYQPGTVEALLHIAERERLTVISDEVYEDIVFEGSHRSLASVGAEAPVVTVFSFSKGYAMTGWRIGYLSAPRAVSEAVVKAQEAVIACPPALAQHAAEAALRGPQRCVAEMRDAYRRRRDVAVELLRARGLLAAAPRGTFYVLADVSSAGVDTYEVAKRLLLEQQVAVAPGETFGPEGRGLVRLSLASPPEVIAEGVRRIGASMEEWAAGGRAAATTTHSQSAGKEAL
jgi:aspartate/methionine/tyrosine aminotransferase